MDESVDLRINERIDEENGKIIRRLEGYYFYYGCCC